MSAPSFRPPSFWLATLGEPIAPRSALAGEQRADVAIVGGGYTGLWTAYYLKQHDPALCVAVVESEVAGFGASGRNGGWCSAHLSGIESWLAKPALRERAQALQRAMFDAVDEVGAVAARESIDCDYAKGGMLGVATCAPEELRLRAAIDAVGSFGFSEEDYRWIDTDACNARMRMAGARGALYSPHCAALHPAKLVRGLAALLEARGVAIFERSAAREIRSGEVVTRDGRLLAPTVLRCTEAYTRRLPGLERQLLPMHSMMIATEPLPQAVWKEIGLASRETFSDGRRVITYGQRTVDGRLAFGARGLYFYGSGIRDYFEPDDEAFVQVRNVLVQLFPVLADVEITHRWGGALGVTRDWRPFVTLDRATGRGTAGGYAGNGVAAANLAGRTLADLVLGRETERTRYPWVDHRCRPWEREPLRWLAVTGVRRLGDAADRREKRGASPGLAGSIFDTFAGH